VILYQLKIRYNFCYSSAVRLAGKKLENSTNFAELRICFKNTVGRELVVVVDLLKECREFQNARIKDKIKPLNKYLARI